MLTRTGPRIRLLTASEMPVARSNMKAVSTWSGTYVAMVGVFFQTSPTVNASGLASLTVLCQLRSHSWVSGVFS